MKDGPRIAIRTTGGAEAGLGHVHRCLALAQALRTLGAECRFLVDGDDGVLARVRRAGFGVTPVNPGRDLADTRRACEVYGPGAVVVDTYAAGAAYFSDLAGRWALVAIDDLTDRNLPVDLVVNGSPDARRLAARETSRARQLLGPSYAMLRPEFAEPPARTMRPDIRRALVTLGGGSQGGLTARVVRWTAKTLSTVAQDVVVGPYVRHAQTLLDEGGPGVVVVHQDPPAMRPLMLGADLAVCAGGQTACELAATGTPAVAIQTAENQTGNLRALAAAGALVWAGRADDTDLEATLTDAVAGLASDAVRRGAMSRCGRALVDGHGAGRVARAILPLAGARA